MRQMVKPNLAIWDVSVLDKEALPPDASRHLIELLPREADGKLKHDFIRRLDRTVHVLSLNRGSKGAASMRDDLKQLAKDARALLQAINRLGRGTVRCLEAHVLAHIALQSDEAPALPKRIVERRIASQDGVCEQAWEAAQALEIAANYAACQIKPRKHVKDSQVRAKLFVRQVAEDYIAVFGTAPPKGQHEWFAHFCEELGRRVGIEAGHKIVRGALTPSRSASAE